jgi:hypothetical protein
LVSESPLLEALLLENAGGEVEVRPVRVPPEQDLLRDDQDAPAAIRLGDLERDDTVVLGPTFAKNTDHFVVLVLRPQGADELLRQLTTPSLVLGLLFRVSTVHRQLGKWAGSTTVAFRHDERS